MLSVSKQLLSIKYQQIWCMVSLFLFNLSNISYWINHCLFFFGMIRGERADLKPCYYRQVRLISRKLTLVIMFGGGEELNVSTNFTTKNRNLLVCLAIFYHANKNTFSIVLTNKNIDILKQLPAFCRKLIMN